MNPYVTFTVVALVALAVSVPVWMILLTGDFSLSTFVDPGFLIALCVAMIALLYGFSPEQTEGDE
jgi:carbon starvation protein CstA